MKRVIYEWGLILAVAMAVILVAVWGISRFSNSPSFHLSFWPLPHVVVRHGDFWLCNDFDHDASGEVRALTLGPPIAADYQRGDRLRRLNVPGFGIQYYWLAPWRNTIWSVRVSALLLALACLLTARVLYRRLMFLRFAQIKLPPMQAQQVHVLDRL